MSGAARKDLLSQLRSRISDDRASVEAFSIAVTAEARSALLEINNGIFTVTFEQSKKLRNIRYNLSDPSVNTVGRLLRVLTALDGISITPDTNLHSDHPSIDLQVYGIIDIANNKAESLRHHLFADEELRDLLSQAMALHNPNYTSIANVPPTEHPYVLMKAMSAAYRILAIDSAKRRGLDTDAKVFLQLAHDVEEQYKFDHSRLARVIPSPKADESKMGAGDVVNGMFFRRSLRAGYNAPYRTALPPTPPNLYDAADDDVEDTQIRLRWSQNREYMFSYYEVWRDTQPVVDRSISGRLANSFPNNSAGIGGGADLPISTQYVRASTSKQVLGVNAGANRVSPIFDGFFFWTAAELAGSNIVNATFIDGLLFNNPGTGTDSILGEPLEPDTDYYYRVYGINWNGEVVPSKVLKVHTKTLRARFKRQGSASVQNAMLASDAISPQTGPLAGGTTITINGTNFPATGLQILLNGKPCTNVTITSTSQLTCQAPAFINSDWIGQKADIVMVSPDGLKDIVIRGWTFTA